MDMCIFTISAVIMKKEGGGIFDFYIEWKIVLFLLQL